MFTSNVDGHFIEAGFDEDQVVECHGSIRFLQAFDTRLSDAIWPSADCLSGLQVDMATFLASEPLPACPPETGKAAGTLARFAPPRCRPSLCSSGVLAADGSTMLCLQA